MVTLSIFVSEYPRISILLVLGGNRSAGREDGVLASSEVVDRQDVVVRRSFPALLFGPNQASTLINLRSLSQVRSSVASAGLAQPRRLHPGLICRHRPGPATRRPETPVALFGLRAGLLAHPGREGPHTPAKKRREDAIHGCAWEVLPAMSRAQIWPE